MKIGAIGIRTKIIVGDAATWYLVKKYVDGKVGGGIDDVPEELKKYVRVLDSWVDVTEDLASIENKVDKVAGKGLSTEDYTTAEKSKVANVPLNTNTELAAKVDKVAGSSLVPDTEIDKLSEYPAFEDLKFSYENLSNKTSDIESNKTSVDKYPNAKGVVDYVAANNQFKFISRDAYNQLTRPLIARDIYFTSPSQFISPLGKSDGFTFQNDKLLFPNYAAPENLVLHYDFSGMTNSDATKGIAKDLSGNGNHGALSGFAYTSGSGYEGGGLRFDGVDDVVGDATTMFAANAAVTTSFVLKIDILASVKGGFMRFQHNNGLFLHFANDYIYLQGATPTTYLSSMKLQVGNIYSITHTYNGSLFNLYVNGVKYMNNVAITTGAIGKLFGTGFKGTMFSIKNYSKELTQSEVTQNYEIDKKRFNITD